MQDLERQLSEVGDEIARAKAQQRTLSEAAHGKQGPAALAKHRHALRTLRPPRERVADEARSPPSLAMLRVLACLV